LIINIIEDIKTKAVSRTDDYVICIFKKCITNLIHFVKKAVII
jgi:hypothetical protein